MTDNPSTNDTTALTAAEKRQADYDSLTTSGGIKTNVRARTSFSRAANNPAEYDGQSPISKLLINLLLMLTQMIDPDNKGNNGIMSMFAKAFGFEDDADHTKFRALRDNVDKKGRENVREELDYSRFDRRAASETLRQGEKEMVQAATGKNVYNSPLLEMIGKHESAGDYNRVYVPPKMPGYGGVRRVDLSNMTVNEVLEWQRNWTNEQRRAGIPSDQCSSAAGKYQFIRATLAGTAKQMGLTGDEKFTPELQDRLAMQQLKNAGYDKYMAGKTNDQTFLNKVANIWSSIPQSNGRSAHAGIGINAAGTTVSSAVSTIQAERAATMAATKPETTTLAFSTAGAPKPPATDNPIIVAGNNKPSQDDLMASYKPRASAPAAMPS